MNSGFNDDLDWASTETSNGFTPTNFRANTINVSKIAAVNEEFLDDFDDDDDAFFSSAGLPSNKDMKVDTTMSATAGGEKKGDTGSLSSFGMMALRYGDASTALANPARAHRITTTNQGGIDASGEDDISDDPELIDLDQKYLSQLRDPTTSFRTVARSCLVCQQFTQSPQNSEQAASDLSSSLEHSLRIHSATIYHIQRYQRLIHRILSSLTTCISAHNSTVCKSLAALTLASTARSSYARLHFDASLFSVRLPPSIATRLEDECGNGVAHTLVVAAIEQANDTVSSSSFEALGRLTLDTDSDELAAEVKTIIENINKKVFSYESDAGISESFHELREMQSKIWDHVLFPRMQRVLHRLSMYTSFHHLAKALPVITAAFVHALTHGADTMPARRRFQCGKSTHARRGWVESDAERLVAEFVDRILLPCFAQGVNSSIKYTAVVACIRLSSACPLAQWRVRVCRNSVVAMSQHVDEIMISSSKNQTTSSVTLNSDFSASVADETLAGAAAILLIALRGIPVQERTPGLASVLRVALNLRMASDLLSSVSSPTSLRQNENCISRVSVLLEVALSVMLDGSKDIGPSSTEEDGNGDEKQRMVGTRAILLNRILQENSLATSAASDDLIWVFCSTFLQIDEKHNNSTKNDSYATADWSNIGLVILDNFASLLRNDELDNRPFASAASDAYSKLLAGMLKSSAVFPPSSLSISEKMLVDANVPLAESKARSIVEMPSQLLPHSSSTLFKLTEAMTLQRSKMVSVHTSFDSTKINVQLNAILCDAWFGRCVSNNDAKKSNQQQLGIAFELLSLLRLDMMTLLQMVGDNVEIQLNLVLYLIRVCIIGVETVACVSEVISHGNSGIADNSDEKVSAAANSSLNGVFTAAKEIATMSQRGHSLCQQVAVDSSNAASRISGYVNNIKQYYRDDVIAALQPSNLGSRTLSSEWSLPETESFFHHYAKLTLNHRTTLALQEYLSTGTSSLSTKSIRPFNPLRMGSTFSTTSILVHQLVRGLPLLVPDRADDDTNVVSLTGSSDPVSLIMSPSMRKVRTSDSNERIVLVATMRLYNVTAVPIENGIRLECAFDEEGENSVCTTSVYKNEIEAGDCITWEVILEDWKVGDVSARVTITFLGLEKESITHKWLHGGDPADHLSVENPLFGEEDEGTMDVAITCDPATISSLFTLQPCPLVFFFGHDGDTDSFNLLWNQMENTSELMVMNTSSQNKVAIDAKRGRISISNGVNGCAFIAPCGGRILCKHVINQGGSNSLMIKTSSLGLISSLVGASSSKTSFVRFVFGNDDLVAKESTSTKMNDNYM